MPAEESWSEWESQDEWEDLSKASSSRKSREGCWLKDMVVVGWRRERLGWLGSSLNGIDRGSNHMA